MHYTHNSHNTIWLDGVRKHSDTIAIQRNLKRTPEINNSHRVESLRIRIGEEGHNIGHEYHLENR